MRRRKSKPYPDAKPGSRAKNRLLRSSSVARWIAGGHRAGEFRTRREALEHCPPGLLPVLVKVPGRERQVMIVEGPA